MARTSSQPTTQSGLPSLVPHGRFKGKPGIALTRPVTVIGSRSRSHVHLVSQSVSKSHAMVVNTGAGFYVRDLASRTHVLVNGKEVKEAELKDGDILGVGPFTFRFTDPEGKSKSRKRAPLPAAVLRLSNRALPMPLEGRVVLIGRRPTCDVVIDDADVSTTHAVVFEMNGKRYIRDLGSRTGTFLRETAIHQESLELGESFRIGNVDFGYAPATDDELGIHPADHDEADDLAGTAPLPMEEPLALAPEPPVVRPAALVVPPRVAETPVAEPEEDELDLSLEPVGDISGDEILPSPPTAPVAPVDQAAIEAELPADLNVPLAPAASEPASPTAVVPGLANDSHMGIDLLPHEEEAEIRSAAAAVTQPAAGLSGLDLVQPESAKEEPTVDHVPTPAAPGESALGLVFTDPDAPDVAEPVAAVEPPAPVAELPTEPEPELDAMDLDGIEVFDKTEPTPESANALDDLLADDEVMKPQADVAPIDADAMTDTAFGREVTAFEGPGTGPLVEAPAAAPEEPAPVDGGAGLELDKELELALAGDEATTPEPAAEADPLVYDESAPAAPVAEATAESDVTSEAAATKRRGGRKAAAPKAAKKAAKPKRKPPSKTAAAAASAVSDEAESAVPSAEPDIAPIPAESADVPAGLASIPADVASIPEEPADIPADVAPVSEEPASIPAEADSIEPAAEAKEPETDEIAAVIEETIPETERLTPVAEESTPDVSPEVIDAELVETTSPSPGTPEEGGGEGLVAAAEEDLQPISVSEHQEKTQEESVAAIDAEIDLAGLSALDDESAPADAPVASEPAPAIDDAPSVEPTPGVEVFDAEIPEASPEIAAESSTPAADPETPPAPGKPVDLFYGLERDTASFLGGLPLKLPPLQGPFSQQNRVDFTQPAASAPVPSAADDVEPEPDEPELVDIAPAGDVPPADEIRTEDVAAAAPPPVAPVTPSRPAPPPPARFSGKRPPRGEVAPARPAAKSPFDFSVDDVPAGGIEIPPYAGPGPATRGQVTTAFDGLAMPPVREADVFSQQPVGRAAAIPAFGGAPAPASTTIPESQPAARTKTPPASADHDEHEQESLDLSTAEDGISPSDDLDLGDEVAVPAGGADEAIDADPAPSPIADARKARQPANATRRPPAYPTDPVGRPAAPKPKKKRWRIGKWGLFSLMVLCMGAASVAIWTLTPVLFPLTAKLTGRINFEKLETLPEANRQQVLAAQRTKLGAQEIRTAAREILTVNHAGVTPGFLAETGSPEVVRDAAKALSKLTESLRLVEKEGALEFTHQALDGAGDEVRVKALLAALYADNKPLKDAEGDLKRKLDEKTAALAKEQYAFEQLQPAAAAALAERGDVGAVAQKQHEIDVMRRKERELSAAWDTTTARVRQLTDGALAAESIVPIDPDADPANLPPVASEDTQVVELTQKAEDLATTIAAQKQERTGKADEAREVMAAALKQFEDDIAKAKSEMKPDSELGRYLQAAEGVQRRLTQLSGELGQQQRSDMDRLTLLKRKLAEKNEERIRKAFATDPDLQALQEDLAVKERQYNTAVSNNLRDDAGDLQKEVRALREEIEARQDLLLTADGVAPGVKEIETFITDTLARMDKDRARNDRIMAEALKELTAKAPAAGTLPNEQKVFAEQLEKRQADLNKAREAYAAAAKAAEAESDEALKTLESDLAALQAKIDERKKSVADAARKQLGQEQQKERATVVAAARRNLDGARKADEDAANAYLAHRKGLAAAEEDLERLKRKGESVDRDNRVVNEKRDLVVSLGNEIAALEQQVNASVVPLAPSAKDVVVANSATDNRKVYIPVACVVIAVVFFALVRHAPLHPELPQDDEAYFEGEDGDVPFAAPLASDPDEPALNAAKKVESETERRRVPDEETPLTV